MAKLCPKSGYTNWGPGLPDNYGYEDCAYMDPGFYGAGGNWNDVWCFQYYNYICKKRITPSSCDDKPCQNSGVCETDGTGGYQCKCKAGYTGKTCQEDNYCQSGWNHYGDFCYRFSDEYLHFDDRHTWQGALARCQSDGANLVSIHSKDESNFIFDHMGYSRGRFWIGLTDQEREGFFKWSDGTKLDFINWSPRIPDNAGNEDCAHIDSVYFGSQWSDVWCGQIYGYVCKKAAEDIDECKSQPCQNDGTCVDLINDYRCDCVAGYDGKDCENNIDECALTTCLPGFVCVDGINSCCCMATKSMTV
ncbi:fibropellin-3-like [Patiria miniata]|uniref:Uncharacterized protein n=1 Tax=Patiria miniata TaxID=46514 RepID=A0A914AQQ6_PATMI|nr:fibropellin-3-like [Patiria miniata]